MSLLANKNIHPLSLPELACEQHFASTFSMQIFKFQGLLASSPSFSRPVYRAPRRACSQTIFEQLEPPQKISIPYHRQLPYFNPLLTSEYQNGLPPCPRNSIIVNPPSGFHSNFPLFRQTSRNSGQCRKYAQFHAYFLQNISNDSTSVLPEILE